jgi:integrase
MVDHSLFDIKQPAVMFTHFMNFVEPIHDRKKIAQINNMLRGEKRFRDLLLFTVGINTALRISDILRLRVEDFFDAQKRLRHRFWIREEKRGKRQEVVVNDSIRTVLAEYVDAYPDIAEPSPSLP